MTGEAFDENRYYTYGSVSAQLRACDGLVDAIGGLEPHQRALAGRQLAELSLQRTIYVAQLEVMDVDVSEEQARAWLQEMTKLMGNATSLNEAIVHRIFDVSQCMPPAIQEACKDEFDAFYEANTAYFSSVTIPEAASVPEESPVPTSTMLSRPTPAIMAARRGSWVDIPPKEHERRDDITDESIVAFFADLEVSVHISELVRYFWKVSYIPSPYFKEFRLQLNRLADEGKILNLEQGLYGAIIDDTTQGSKPPAHRYRTRTRNGRATGNRAPKEV